jgi:hypothetical protein
LYPAGGYIYILVNNNISALHWLCLIILSVGAYKGGDA